MDFGNFMKTLLIIGSVYKLNNDMMKQEDKELLLKDICARLSYGVKISIPDLWTQEREIEILDEIFKGDDGLYRVNSKGQCIEHIKPYLFPLSNLKEDLKQEYTYIVNYINSDDTNNWKEGEFIYVDQFTQLMHFYHKHHIDYRGLIKKDLAIDATNLNIY